MSFESERIWLSCDGGDVTLLGLGAQFSEWWSIVDSQIESVIGTLQIIVKNHDGDQGV